jgi:uncharacterized SAM-binding protein YcdF (DUF218 family)
MFRFLVKTCLALAALWLGGLGWFWLNLPEAQKPRVDVVTTDAIVALTGGPGRIEHALDLLQAKRARRVLISGANPQTTANEIAALIKKPAKLFDCCVDIGYDAGNTIGNAHETALWVRENKFSSVRIVTSRFHMPRSLLEFEATLPDIVVVGDPVNDMSSKSELVREYNKYAFRLIWLRLVLPIRQMLSAA